MTCRICFSLLWWWFRYSPGKIHLARGKRKRIFSLQPRRLQGPTCQGPRLWVLTFCGMEREGEHSSKGGGKDEVPSRWWLTNTPTKPLIYCCLNLFLLYNFSSSLVMKMSFGTGKQQWLIWNTKCVSPRYDKRKDISLDLFLESRT